MQSVQICEIGVEPSETSLPPGENLPGPPRALRQADDRLLAARWAEVGKPVRVARGPLKGLTGEIVSLPSGTRLIIRVTLINQAASLEVDESLVEPDL